MEEEMRQKKGFVKQFLVLIFSASLLVLLTACGGSGTTSSDPAPKETAEATESTNGNEEKAQTETLPANESSSLETDPSNEATTETTAVSEESADKTDTAVINADEEKGLDPSVQYKEGEEKVLDTDKYSVTVTGYDPACHTSFIMAGDDIGSDYFAVSILFENKNDYVYKNTSDDNKAAINRVMTDLYFVDGEGEAIESLQDPLFGSSEFEVQAGETKKALILLNPEPLINEGLTSVDEIIIELNGAMWDDVAGEPVQDVMTMYPTGKSTEDIIPAEKIMEKNLKDNTMIVADQEDFQVGIICEETEEGPLYKTCYYNKSDSRTIIALEDVYVNGIEYCDTSGGKKVLIRHCGDILPGCYDTASINRDFMDENNLTEIEELKAKMIELKESEDIFSSSYDHSYGGEIVNSQDIVWKP